MVKIAYGAKLDSVIKYSAKEPECTLKNKKYLEETDFSILRSRFLLQLIRKHLFLVLELSVFDSTIRFIQIVGGFDVLATRAEEIGFKFQLNPENSRFRGLFRNTKNTRFRAD